MPASLVTIGLFAALAAVFWANRARSPYPDTFRIMAGLMLAVAAIGLFFDGWWFLLQPR